MLIAQYVYVRFFRVVNFLASNTSYTKRYRYRFKAQVLSFQTVPFSISNSYCMPRKSRFEEIVIELIHQSKCFRQHFLWSDEDETEDLFLMSRWKGKKLPILHFVHYHERYFVSFLALNKSWISFLTIFIQLVQLVLLWMETCLVEFAQVEVWR